MEIVQRTGLAEQRLRDGDQALSDAVRVIRGYAAQLGVAARMRHPDGPREVTLVLNNEPDDDPLGCDRMLPSILRRGSRLTVWVVDADGPRFFKTYVGTGEGVAP